MPTRLTGQHRHLGDDGASMLLQGGRKISKGSPAAHLYGSIEWVQQAIATVRASNLPWHLEEHLDLDDDVKFLTWLDHALGSVSAWVWMNGESTDHALPVEALDWLDKRCKHLADLGHGEAQDFETWDDPKLLALNALRLHVRDTERWFATWWHSDTVTPVILANPEIGEQYQITAAFLNRLSTWVYLVTRLYARWLYENGVITARVWAGKMPDFPLR